MNDDDAEVVGLVGGPLDGSTYAVRRHWDSVAFPRLAGPLRLHGRTTFVQEIYRRGGDGKFHHAPSETFIRRPKGDDA